MLRADRFIEDLSGDCCMNYSFFIMPCLLLFTVVSDKKKLTVGVRLKGKRILSGTL